MKGKPDNQEMMNPHNPGRSKPLYVDEGAESVADQDHANRYPASPYYVVGTDRYKEYR